ncbi:hypothetical protein LCGC14_0498560 [marine sediment metagenome]|uniref:Uncharacterized protein n=1 Tax=marine sediment metagenome TaxID=412755 RepID=A0A0F9SN10_9ZZZZ
MAANEMVIWDIKGTASAVTVGLGGTVPTITVEIRPNLSVTNYR